MRIAPVFTAQTYKANNASFGKKEEQKPEYSTWGGNYAFPVETKKAEAEAERKPVDLTPNPELDRITVDYRQWGSNYPIPVTLGDLKTTALQAREELEITKKAAMEAEETTKSQLYDISEDDADDKVVGYSSCGPDYTFPITAGTVREAHARLAEQREAKIAKAEERVIEAEKAVEAGTTKAQQSFDAQHTETKEEYLARKLYSTEWTT